MRHSKQNLWAQRFELPDRPALTLQARLREAIVRAILDGSLTEGTALPSSRDLAMAMQVSRNTVTAVYQQLVDDGFLTTRPRSGVFVAEGARQVVADPPAPAAVSPELPPNSSLAGAPATGIDWTSRLRRTLSDRSVNVKPERWREYPYPFIYGAHDPQLFPTEDFRECCMRSLARAQLAHWAPDFEVEDVPDLVEQIRLRVLPKRGVFAQPEEIVITVGAQQAFNLLAEALVDRNTAVAIEEPGYLNARNSFVLRQAQLKPLPVDGDGACVDALPAADYVFVTPSQQSPTTATLSLARRHALLARADREGFVVIEDDYEADNLHEGVPLPALKSLDRSGHVIYVGSLAKSLSSAVRLGFIVAPAALALELRRLRLVMVRHPSAFLQHAYALFLSLGHHESHARRVNVMMAQRMTTAAAALRRHLPSFRFVLPNGGSSIWLSTPDGIDGAALARTARAHGVLIEAGDAFYLQPSSPCPHFRLRLSSIAPDLIEPGIIALKAAFDELAAGLDP